MEVMGNQYNGVMPSMAHLSNAELAAVLTYIRSSWSNSASPVDEQLFVEARERFGERDPWAGGDELIEEVGKPLMAGGS